MAPLVQLFTRAHMKDFRCMSCPVTTRAAEKGSNGQFFQLLEWLDW